MTDILSGKRYRSRVADRQEDDDYGEVTHPVGTMFTVGRRLEGHGYVIEWDAAIVTATGDTVPPQGCVSMWTVWTAEQIARDAEEVQA